MISSSASFFFATSLESISLVTVAGRGAVAGADKTRTRREGGASDWPVWNTWNAENRVASTAAVAPITPGFTFAVVPSSGEAAASSSTFFFAASSRSAATNEVLT